MEWIVYMLACADGSLYTGITNNLAKRIDVHNQGKAAKYTAPRTPVTLVWHEAHSDRSQATKREYEIKQLPRHEKLKLIEHKAH